MEIGKFGMLTIFVIVVLGLGGFFGYSQVTALNTRMTNLEARMVTAETNSLEGKQAYDGLKQLKPYVDMTAATANKAAKDVAAALDAATKAAADAAAAKDEADKSAPKRK